MKFLITGAAGFIGSHTAQRIKSLGHEVIGVDNFSPYYDVALKKRNALILENLSIPIITCDIRYNEQLYQLLPKDFDYILHFAAHPGISDTSSFEDYFSNNLIATKNLLDFAEISSKKPFIINIATSSIYGSEATLTEKEAPKPTSFYGVTKLAAEQLVLAKVRLGELNGCSFRLYSVYGPRERPDKLYTRLIACGLKNIPFTLYEGSLTHLRSFTYVGDIVDGIVSVLGKETQCNGEIINLGTEEEHSTQEGIAAVEKLLGKPIQKETVAKRKGDQLRTKANIEKAKKLLNYHPKTTLEEGLKQQINWYKETFL
ncbi:MAG: 3-beta hydroxysteroid dehydrogenase [Bacteroidetes bacterium HGW-Bacteroidetes-2]|jgi:nucleoside-diphosphate-sugar epimerase|nr:MAG: 3-beta hydroxysteroid dehydrogenase [Bacteroidetes bacterium HGW-Bacteroidetes-2]